MGRSRKLTIPQVLRSFGAVTLLASLFLGAPGISQGQGITETARLKAIHLRNIMSFVQWPPEALPVGNGEFLFCVAGDHFLGSALTSEMRGVTIQNRRVMVQWVQPGLDLKRCQALFIGDSEQNHTAKLLENLAAAKVLTFGESSGFLEAGGIVRLIYEDSGIRFEVNLTAARNSGFKMDARLLGLAKRVVKNEAMPGG